MQPCQWEANSFSAGQKFTLKRRNPKSLCRVQNRLPFVPILSQISPVVTRSPHFFKIRFNTILIPPTPGTSKWPFSLRFPIQTQYAPLFSTTSDTCHTQPFLLTLTCFNTHKNCECSEVCHSLEIKLRIRNRHFCTETHNVYMQMWL